MKKRRYDAIFLLDQIPYSNVGGAPSYNAALLRASEALGWRILVLVTGRRLPGPIFSTERVADNATLVFAQAVSMGGNRFVASTPSSFMRGVKRVVEKYRKPRQATEKRLIIERFPNAAEVDRVHRILDRIEAPLTFVDTIFRDPYMGVDAIAPNTVLIGHDVFHERVASFEANGFQVVPNVDFDAERARVTRYKNILAISDVDAATYRRMAPHSDVRTVFPIVPKAAGPRLTNPQSNRIVYLGSAAHHNVDGLVWFLDQIWPRVLKRRPDAVLDVVGMIGHSISPHPNVMVHGRVDDISAISRQAAFAINPIRMGSGLKIKMVDYFNLGLGCITTDVGAHGFPIGVHPFMIANEEDEFADAVETWLKDASICQEMSEKTDAYMRHFSLEAIMETLKLCTAALPER
ncbi:glycosyltransferase [Neorhizobium sp. P12A]|uniref:glycosyltransferase n=1 Tax=Neorhizobium sp. P12A TaxID=2268027 RepID=UPI0011F002CA|nr:glycosyltransferase [Neorhizobium sp. P12A]KAA0681726.1 glycosyltransferase [Neorhizobium sp. P12A]